MESPLEAGEAAVERIVFSSCGIYVAHYVSFSPFTISF